MLSFANAIRQMGKMSFLIGESEDGNMVCSGLDRTAHLFISGTTGTGKSVFLNSLLLSLMLHNRPDHLKLILYDSKVVELSIYSQQAHLLFPVLAEQVQLKSALKWIETEMMNRLTALAKVHRRSIDEYNDLCEKNNQIELVFPRIVVVIDDLSDAIKEYPAITELLLNVLSKSRAVGIHFLLSVQSTSRKDIQQIAGLIPQKVTFFTLTKKESRVLVGNESACSLGPCGSAIFSPAIGNSLQIKTIMAEKSEENMILEIGAKNFIGYNGGLCSG